MCVWVCVCACDRLLGFPCVQQSVGFSQCVPQESLLWSDIQPRWTANGENRALGLLNTQTHTQTTRTCCKIMQTFTTASLSKPISNCLKYIRKKRKVFYSMLKVEVTIQSNPISVFLLVSCAISPPPSATRVPLANPRSVHLLWLLQGAQLSAAVQGACVWSLIPIVFVQPRCVWVCLCFS